MTDTVATTPRPLSAGRRRLALTIALIADAAQWLWLPLVIGGAVSPINDVIDVCVGLMMLGLIGFHWALVPSFIAELVPFVDLVPSWTLAVWIATRGRGEAPASKSHAEEVKPSSLPPHS